MLNRGVRAAAPIFAGLWIAAVVACGSSTPSETDGNQGFPTGDGGTTVLPDGAVVVHSGKSQSCSGEIGADKKCGDGTQDCCEARAVPGGSFNRFNNPNYKATVSPFILDTFEVTVGRFRAWVAATKGNLRSSAPAAGGGAHPKIPNSGWRTEWNTFLPTTTDEVDRMFGPDDGSPGSIIPCQYGTDIDDLGALTWWTDSLDKAVKDRNKGKDTVLSENTKDALDRKPLNCVPWHVMFAFCVWDGGRLPTDAEFEFAATGGSEQRAFPWGAVDPSNEAHIDGDHRTDLSEVPVFDFGQKYASARLYDKTLGQNFFEDNYSFTYGGKVMNNSDNATHIAPVGHTPLGNGKWGHADLAGGMFEWMLDEGPIKPGTCTDCAATNWPGIKDKDPNVAESDTFADPGGIDWYVGGTRAIRGGAWDNAQGFANGQTDAELEFLTSYPILRTYRAVGGRCARD